MPAPTKGLIKCKRSEISLQLTLLGGQSFRWKQQNDGAFVGVAYGHFWELRSTEKSLHYTVQSTSEVGKSVNYPNLLKKYLRFNFNLEENFEKWKMAHKHFQETASVFQAVRVLDQEPLENLISFICSQNNNIKRISMMVEWLCSSYGEKICTFDGVDYYAFPTLEALLKPGGELETSLRKAKFGYRAKFIAAAVQRINEFGGDKWFASLKQLPFAEARQELVKLPGVGFKVADCICLMSLDCLESVPIDTHIFKIAQNSYLPDLKALKSVTPKVYEDIAGHFREVYGEFAGWAQAVLFCSGLQQFQGKKAKEGNKKRRKVDA